MFKKLLLASAILAASSTVAMAATPYVGIGTGVIVNTDNLGTGYNDYDVNVAYRGIPVNVFAGFGGIVSQSFYLAGELGGTVGTFNINDGLNYLKTSYTLGLSAIPGVMLSDHTMAFARLGVVNANFSSASTHLWGGEVGAGLQTSLTPNLDLRGEYDYVAYRDHGSFDSTPRSDQFNVALVYNFI